MFKDVIASCKASYLSFIKLSCFIVSDILYASTCPSLCIVSTTMILNSGVYLLFGFPLGIKYPLSLDFKLVYFYYTILSNKRGAFQTLVTNLFDDEFSVEEIKKLYKMRWGIETSFRELKYHIGLIAFHSKKKDCVIQEIFASLIMYNFSMLITDDILIDDDKHNKYRSKINYATAIHICIAFFRYNRISPSNLEKLIARNKCPVRPDRIATRKSCYHSAVSFNYRLS